jgi:thiol:disulfide interchange protein
VWLKDQYREALAKRAPGEGMLVFVNFTGYACTNCHWMKANMFTAPRDRSRHAQGVRAGGPLRRRHGDAASEENAKMEERRFNTVSIPFYAILDPDEKVIATFPEATRDAQKFAAFLKSGADNKIASSKI